MSTKKVTGMTALASASLASGDLVMVVDVSDTTGASTGTNKKVSLKDAIELWGGSIASNINSISFVEDAGGEELGNPDSGYYYLFVDGNGILTLRDSDGNDTVLSRNKFTKAFTSDYAANHSETFTFSADDHTLVFFNGIELSSDDYSFSTDTLTNDTITLTFPIVSGDRLTVKN